MEYVLIAETPLGIPRYWAGDRWSLFEEEALRFPSLKAAILYCRERKRFDAEVIVSRTDAHLVCVVTCPHGVSLLLSCGKCDTL